MAKRSTKVSTLNSKLTSGWVLSLSSMVLALLFLLSVIDTVLHKVAHHLQTVPAPFIFAAIAALVVAGVSVWWEKQARLLVGLTCGVVLASIFIWQFGLH